MTANTKKLREAFPTLKIEQSLTADAERILVHKVAVNNKRARASVTVEFSEAIDSHSLDEITYALQSQIFDQCNLSLNLQILSQPEHHEEEPDTAGGMPLEEQMAQIPEEAFVEYQAAYEAELEITHREDLLAQYCIVFAALSSGALDVVKT